MHEAGHGQRNLGGQDLSRYIVSFANQPCQLQHRVGRVLICRTWGGFTVGLPHGAFTVHLVQRQVRPAKQISLHCIMLHAAVCTEVPDLLIRKSSNVFESVQIENPFCPASGFRTPHHSEEVIFVLTCRSLPCRRAFCP